MILKVLQQSLEISLILLEFLQKQTGKAWKSHGIFKIDFCSNLRLKEKLYNQILLIL